jgi:4-cresol dehydrogenase (hydroxylating)
MSSENLGATAAPAAEPFPTLPEAFVTDLTAVLDPARIVLDRESLAPYKDPYWIPGDETFAAGGLVYPTSVAEVQEIVRLCARHDIKVWPHGQGRNYGYGGASPRDRKSVV